MFFVLLHTYVGGGRTSTTWNTTRLFGRNAGANSSECCLLCVTWNTRRLNGSPTSSKKLFRKYNFFSRLIGSNDIICFQHINGKHEFLHALVRQYQEANAGGSAICIHQDLLPGRCHLRGPWPHREHTVHRAASFFTVVWSSTLHARPTWPFRHGGKRHVFKKYMGMFKDCSRPKCITLH